MTRLRQQMNALDNVIRDDRFNAARERKAMIDREYDNFMREVNAAPMEQLEATRGGDPIADDLAWIAFGLLAGVMVGVLAVIVKFRIWEFFG